MAKVKKQPKPIVGEVEQPKGAVNEEDISLMQEEAQKHSRDYNKRQMKKVKEIRAVKENLFKRKKEPHLIKVPIDEKDGEIIVYTFEARRLTAKERSEIGLKEYTPESLLEMNEEEFAAVERKSYETLEKVIIDPQMSADEWQDLDIALTQQLIMKATVLQFETNEAELAQYLGNL